VLAISLKSHGNKSFTCANLSSISFVGLLCLYKNRVQHPDQMQVLNRYAEKENPQQNLIGFCGRQTSGDYGVPLHNFIMLIVLVKMLLI